MELFIIPFVGFLAFAVIGIFWLLRIFEDKRLLGESLGYALLRVALPRKDPQPYEKAKEEIGAFEQFLATLQNFKHPVVAEIAVQHVGEEIRFYFAASRNEIDALERSIHSFWPDAFVERTLDYNIFNPEGEHAVSIGSLREHFALPIKRWPSFNADPLGAITNAFSKLAHEGEGAAVQFVFCRAPRSVIKPMRYILQQLKKGERREVAFRASAGARTMKFLSETFAGPQKPKAEDQFAQAPMVKQSLNETLIKSVTEKMSKPMLAWNLRIVTSAKNAQRAESIAEILEHAFDQFSDPNGNEIIFRKLRGAVQQKAIFDFSFRNFRRANTKFVTTEELASMLHLPTSSAETPKVEKVKAKTAIAPLNLPPEGLILGKNVFRGEERLVKILLDDRRRHMYIVGQTGTGKTVLLQEMARQDIEAGEGVCVIDPHGDFAETVLGFVPEHRIRDVVYFNPTDINRPIGLNMLEFDPAHPEQKTFVINEMIEIMDKLYDLRQVGGPMFEQYLRNAMLLIMGDPVIKATIMEIPKVLADASFRRELLARCANPSVVSFWTKEAEKAGGEFALANMVPYITSKLNPFIANDIVRPIVGQIETRFRARDIMDNRKIFIVNLAKGVLGETNSYLLGMIIIGKLMMAALSRVNVPEDERRDFYMYIDEFHNVTTKTVASILAEARKYRLSMIMAHQFLGQLKEEIRDAVFGNVGTMISFRIGPPDAELLEKQFLPTFTKHDLINIDNYGAYIKLLISGQVTLPFNMQTFPPQRPDIARREEVKAYSRNAYGRPREEVEAEIAERVQA